MCLTQPADASSVSGPVAATGTVSISGIRPANLRWPTFYLDGTYLLSNYDAPFTFTLATDQFVDGGHVLGFAAQMSDGFTSTQATVSLTFHNGVTTPPINPTTFTPTTGSAPAPGQPFVIAAVGDGANGSSHDAAVSSLVASWNPNLFLYLGDVYLAASSMEFYNWYGQHDESFGLFKGITNPTIGNHEYAISNTAAPYMYYWNNIPHYYSYNVAGWHMVSLDNTGEYDQTAPGTGQYQWLTQDLQCGCIEAGGADRSAHTCRSGEARAFSWLRQTHSDRVRRLSGRPACLTTGARGGARGSHASEAQHGNDAQTTPSKNAPSNARQQHSSGIVAGSRSSQQWNAQRK